MSVEWEWPTSWDPMFVQDLRFQLQTRLREAMSKNKNSQLRGNVEVHSLSLGQIPPDIALKEILHVSANSTKVELWIRYEGDASITLKGLEINLDTTSSGDVDDEGPNHLNPFFCPFEMTMHRLRLEGCVVVELKQSLSKAHRQSHSSSSSSGGGGGRLSTPKPEYTNHANNPPLLPMHALQHSNPGTTAPSRAASFGRRSLQERLQANPGTGVGILLSGGGRSHMRPPKGESTAAGGQSHYHHHHVPSRSLGPSYTWYELGTEQCVCHTRRIKIQCCDDPLKSFSIQSNFDSLGAQSKVEATLRSVIQPLIDYLKTQGLTLSLPAQAAATSGDTAQ